MEQELLALPEYLGSPRVFSGVPVALIFTLFYVVFCRSVFVLLPLAFLLYVLIRLMSCHYPFGIFKLLLLQRKKPEKETNIFYKINTVVLILNKSLEAVSIKTEVDYVVVRER